MRKIYVKSKDDFYVQVGRGLILPFFDLVRGVPKHETNSKMFYDSTYKIMRISTFITYIFLFIIIYPVLMNGVMTQFISLLLILLVSQINNFRRNNFFKDYEYTKFCKKYFVRTLVQVIILFIISISGYLIYISYS